jgi:hypothetical protein
MARDKETPTRVIDDESSTLVCSSCGARLQVSKTATSAERLAAISTHFQNCARRRR